MSTISSDVWPIIYNVWHNIFSTFIEFLLMRMGSAIGHTEYSYLWKLNVAKHPEKNTHCHFIIFIISLFYSEINTNLEMVYPKFGKIMFIKSIIRECEGISSFVFFVLFTKMTMSLITFRFQRDKIWQFCFVLFDSSNVAI